MPFKNKAQMRACYAKGDKSWDCAKWIKEGGVPKANGPKPRKMRG